MLVLADAEFDREKSRLYAAPVRGARCDPGEARALGSRSLPAHAYAPSPRIKFPFVSFETSLPSFDEDVNKIS